MISSFIVSYGIELNTKSSYTSTLRAEAMSESVSGEG